jgi:hypothetical protein
MRPGCPNPRALLTLLRIHDYGNGLDYVLVGGWHYLPDFGQGDDDNDCQLETWARRCLRFIKNHRRVLYGELLTSGKLAEHLCEIDRSAEAMFGIFLPFEGFEEQAPQFAILYQL